jgi:hypothetical protein
VIIESGEEPPQQLFVPLPLVATSLIVEQLTGTNDVLQPLPIAEPAQLFPTVLIEPTFWLSQ